MICNALTIDVEDYFQVSAFETIVHRPEWQRYPLRVGENTRRILDILDEKGTTATFFILGWVAEREPSLVREIHGRGHEVACHGYGHQRVPNQTRHEFRDDIRKSKGILEDLIGKPVVGYRAPSYSISLNTLWAFDELVETGYLYDSSVFPVRHDYYGIPNWPRFPFFVARGDDGVWSPDTAVSSRNSTASCSSPKLLEIPITTVRIAGKNLPISGGGYFRLFPYLLSHWGLQRINLAEKRPFVFYLHPWEIDPDQPRMMGIGMKTRFRHYLNLCKTEQRFRKLLADFKFSTMSRLIETELAR
jgi:polysaccharide deacetylase family protein (PEP-CTERM system associated)